MPSDPAKNGLDQPSLVVTLRGKIREKKAEPKKLDDKDEGKKEEAKKEEPPRFKEKEWKLTIGGESADKAFVYVRSSDRPERPFAISKASIDSLFFKDPNHLRSRRRSAWEPGSGAARWGCSRGRSSSCSR